MSLLTGEAILRPIYLRRPCSQSLSHTSIGHQLGRFLRHHNLRLHLHLVEGEEEDTANDEVKLGDFRVEQLFPLYMYIIEKLVYIFCVNRESKDCLVFETYGYLLAYNRQHFGFNAWNGSDSLKILFEFSLGAMKASGRLTMYLYCIKYHSLFKPNSFN